jgi:polyhydroxyalkanoate synthesis regulator phasin
MAMKIETWHDLRTIEDALTYCKERVISYNSNLTKDEKERLASTILPFSFSDYYHEWEHKFPIVDRIEELASDLEWSNAFDIDEDWQKLKAAIDELDRQVHAKS